MIASLFRLFCGENDYNMILIWIHYISSDINDQTHPLINPLGIFFFLNVTAPSFPGLSSNMGSYFFALGGDGDSYGFTNDDLFPSI